MQGNTKLLAKDAAQMTTELYELLVKATCDAVRDLDLRTGEIWWNDSFQTNFGLLDNKQGTDVSSWHSRLHPDDKERILGSIEEVTHKGQKNWQDEYRFRKADGSYAYVLDRSYLLYDEKGPYRMIGSMIDITEKRRAEVDQKQTEEWFRNLADQVPVMLWVIDAEARCTYVNKQWLDYTGQTLEEALGMGWLKAVHPEDMERSEIAMLEAARQQAPFNLDYRLRRNDGLYRWMLDAGKPQFDAAGRFLGYIGSVTDISKRKQAEEKRLESEERLRMAIESTELGTWDFDLVQNELKWDTKCKELFGLSPDAFVDYSVFLAGLHPDEREKTNQIVQWALDKKSGGYYDIEFRTIGIEDKKLRWIRAKGRAFFNAQEKPYRFIGTVVDITNRKLSEEKLARSEERLRQALDVAHTGTWRIDLETGLDTRDANLNKIIGLEAEETVISSEDSFLRLHADDVERMKKAMQDAVANMGEYKEECRIFRPDGSMLWLRDKGRVIADEEGNPCYIIGAATDITEEKAREEQLRINEERFRGLFHNSSVSIGLVDLNGKFTDVNPELCKLTGYTHEELTGMDVILLSDPAYYAETRRQMEKLILGEIDRFTIQKRYIRKDGEFIWVQPSVSIVRNDAGHPKHFIGVIHDINQQKQAEESLKLQARVLESMDEGVSVSDENGIILYTNSAEDRMFGYAQGELSGQHVKIQNAYSPGDNERIVQQVISELRQNGYWNGEWHNKRKDGSSFYTYSHITSLNLGDKNVLVCVQRDITEEKRTKEALQKSAGELEKKVEERTRELKEANEHLAKSNAELEQFAYVTSHDLQEPLRKIKTFAYRIEDELKHIKNEAVSRYLDKLIGSSERMSTLIRDLLNYSRLSKEKPQFEPVNLNEILKDVVDDFEILVHQKNAEIICDELPAIKGIPLQMTQLFFNLVGNSLKFTRPGVPPRIRISAEKLPQEEAAALGLPASAYIVLSFADNGIGFDAKYKDQVFEIFQRLNSKEHYAGTGIGLALSKRVVQNHQGIILADPVPGQGTTFRVYLPEEGEQ